MIFGVTEIQSGDTPDTMLRRADRALFTAKQRGRNLVVQLGGLTNATGIMTGFAVLSVVAIILGRETRDEQLPR